MPSLATLGTARERGVPAPAPPGLDLSVVIPIYNEAENIEELLDELTQVLQRTDHRYEILAVDDGSTDGSYEILMRLRICAS
jgi:glycosyltransferase involved in cell wall biosynthesis